MADATEDGASDATDLLKHLRRVSRPIFRHASPGAPPGRLAELPEQSEAQLEVIAYDANDYVREDIGSISELAPYHEKWKVVWLNVEGVGDPDALRAFGDAFGVSSLALEDVQNVGHRPKVDFADEYTHIILKMASREDVLTMEQVSMFFGDGFVVTFQEANVPGDCLDPVRRRVIDGVNKIRTSGADYLAYAILDRIIDAFFLVLEDYGESFSELEAEILNPRGKSILADMHGLNSELLHIQRAVRPHREIAQALLRNPDERFSETTAHHLTDCHDHAVQIAELADSYHTLGTHLVNYHLSLASHRQNEITKVLTIIATIFIPLTFVAGIYGMNFNPESSPLNMPELGWYWGYPAVLGFMLFVGIALVLFFVKRGWIGRGG